MIYEPLFFYDTAKAGQITPWLGTSYAWSNGGQTLTVQLKHNVQWTDGKPFTSADVVFTFNQALHSTALNKFALPLASVSADGTLRVTINFTKVAYTDAYYALGRVEILPEHIWKSVPTNPATFLNEHPVGTGAYILTEVLPAGLRADREPALLHAGPAALQDRPVHQLQRQHHAGRGGRSGRARLDRAFIPKSSIPTCPNTRSSWSVTSRWPPPS